MNKVLLIDGNSLMFRAFYATAYTGNLMQTKSGLYTNAVFGFANMVNKILSDLKPDYLFIAFDKGKKTFRHQMYNEYKSGRVKLPEELGMQIPLVKEYINVLGIRQLECDEFEADDLVGSCADKFKDQVDEVIVISQDKDLLQLVEEKITVASPKSGVSELIYYNVYNFKELMGIEHTQLTDYKGLIGDNSDNLPGVSGVGPKTAQKLLEEYKTLENIFENVHLMKGKLAEKLTTDKEVALRTKQLATLVRNVQLDLTLEDLVIQKPKYDELRKFYERLEFTSFIKKMNEDNTNESDKNELVDDEVITYSKEYSINDIQMFEEKIDKQEKNKIMIEVELDGENYHKSNLLGVALMIDNCGFYFDAKNIHHKVLKDFFQKENEYYAIDIKKVYVALAKEGIFLPNFRYDFILATYILNPSNPSQDLHNNFHLLL